MTRESKFYTRQVSSILSFALSVYGNVHYFIFHARRGEYQTPFTGFFITTLIFWSLQYLLQLNFVLQFFTKNESTTIQQQQKIDSLVGYHFIMNNLLNFFWFYTFRKHHFIISFILLVVNFLNLMSLYVVHKSYSIKSVSDWIAVHMSTLAMPIAWVVFAIFWNGAIVFHSHGKSLILRILANILVWDFLLVPMCFLAFYNDYGVGFAMSLLTLGLAINQFATRIIALQWIFATIITCLVFIASALAASGEVFVKHNGRASDEEAPLLTG